MGPKIGEAPLKNCWVKELAYFHLQMMSSRSSEPNFLRSKLKEDIVFSKIQVLREDLNISRAELSDLAGISNKRLADAERFLMELDFEEFQSIGDVLGVRAASLYVVGRDKKLYPREKRKTKRIHSSRSFYECD